MNPDRTLEGRVPPNLPKTNFLRSIELHGETTLLEMAEKFN